MTWGEFKKLVEEQGLKGTDWLTFIDWTHDRDPVVHRDQMPVIHNWANIT